MGELEHFAPGDGERVTLCGLDIDEVFIAMFMDDVDCPKCLDKMDVMNGH